MAIEIGAKGLAEVNLTIPQDTSLTFTVVHKDEDGNTVDHSQSVANMAFQSKDRQTFADLDACVTCQQDSIIVAIPASVSEDLPIGKMNWDIIVTMVSGEQIRLCYGAVSIVDTYALDEEQ